MKFYADIDLTNHQIVNQQLLLKTSYFRGSSGGFWDTVNSVNGGGSTVESQTRAVDNCLVALRLRTGTASNGGAQARQASSSFYPENGVKLTLTTRCKIPVLSTAADEFIVTIGFMNSVTAGGTVTSGYALRYNRAISGNWLAFDGSVSQDTGIAATTDWFTVVFEVIGTTCKLTFNNSYILTLSRILPAAVHVKLEIVKTAGTNSRELLNDYTELFTLS